VYRLLTAVVALVVALGASAAAATRVARDGHGAWLVGIQGPARADVTVARLDFRLGQHVRGAPSGTAHVTLPTGSGLDYVTVERLPTLAHGRVTLLAAIANRRPAGALYPDIARIGLRVAGGRLSRGPSAIEVANPFTARRAGRAVPMPKAGLCDVGAPAVASGHVVLQVGASFGYGPHTVLAQSLDAACNRPYDSAFARALDVGACIGISGLCCPPCGPSAGAASDRILCPLAAQPSIACPARAPRQAAANGALPTGG